MTRRIRKSWNMAVRSSRALSVHFTGNPMINHMLRLFLLFVVLGIGVAHRAPAQQPKTRDQLVREDRSNVDELKNWIYNDVAAGFEAARSSGKPLLIIFRCIPCKACAQLDQNVIEAGPLLEELLDKFVCVRVVHANGMDLRLFQFDYDQSVAPNAVR
jgi:serine protease Do